MNASSTVSQEQRSLGSPRQITSFHEAPIAPSLRAMTEALAEDIAKPVHDQTLKAFGHERSRSARSTHHAAITKREQKSALIASTAFDDREHLHIARHQ